MSESNNPYFAIAATLAPFNSPVGRFERFTLEDLRQMAASVPDPACSDLLVPVENNFDPSLPLIGGVVIALCLNKKLSVTFEAYEPLDVDRSKPLYLVPGFDDKTMKITCFGVVTNPADPTLPPIEWG